MKKIAVLAMSLIFVGTAAFAQEKAQRVQDANAANIPNREKTHQMQMSPEQRAEQMKKDYNLTEKQTADLTAFFKKQQEQRAEMMKNGQADRQNRQAEMQKMHDANQQELQKILGDENYKKFTEQQRQARMKENGQRLQNNERLQNAEQRFQRNDSTMSKRRLERRGQQMNRPINENAAAKIDAKETTKADLKAAKVDAKAKKAAAKKAKKAEVKATKEAATTIVK